MAKAAGSLYFLCDTTKNHQMNGPVITEVSTGVTTQCIGCVPYIWNGAKACA